MIDEICREIRNYFTDDKDKRIGNYTIVNNEILPDLHIPNGQYFRIVGSIFNDGVYKMGDDLQLEPEAFYGAIWLMRPPKSFIELVEDIEQWQAKNGGADSVAMSPFESESFGGYSYSKSTGSDSNGASGTSWISTYSSRLAQYRKIRL